MPSGSAGHAIHIEVRLKPYAALSVEAAKNAVDEHLRASYVEVRCETELRDWSASPILTANVDRIRIGESPTGEQTSQRLDESSLQIHVYQPPAVDILDEFSASDPNVEDGDETTAASVIELPNRSLDGVWDSLVYEEDIKPKLLNYIYTTLLFSDASVDFNLVSWNRVVLLHGPPGTGKTSLCKALAQKLAVRLSHRYTHGKLVEINSHSLFSKWFSESGKLVQRLFSMITEMVDDEDAFVVVLIDEVESLTSARSAASSGTEPSDAIRVVNALLTQLDKLKHRKNVLIMTTSNITESIDTAFIDRADIKQYIGLPPPKAVYWILESCLNELMRVRLVQNTQILPYGEIESIMDSNLVLTQRPDGRTANMTASAALLRLAHSCTGLSGRTLRRLPVLAHARHIGMATSPTPCDAWIKAMRKAVAEIKSDLQIALQGSKGTNTHAHSGDVF
ncbi:P-loop containing nucleoside triphosphate hydrolase protein [Testicularia cyperi]|uniref:P-loop containing nucleoside triphosphate hydrolase protein n=1 Tax=Testicularia cyperi TaxID=1882483 RepID=A0A317XNE3_9BASI|nr:P-loop containing nucleoside triphosphate hydrolase protein [Testicularia cyperi]